MKTKFTSKIKKLFSEIATFTKWFFEKRENIFDKGSFMRFQYYKGNSFSTK